MITKTKSAWVQGLFGGIAGGFVISFLGLILSLTGIGAIIGIPMIIFGIFMVIGSPMASFFIIKGECPYCGYEIVASSTSPGITCKACKNRIVIRKKQFIKINDIV